MPETSYHISSLTRDYFSRLCDENHLKDFLIDHLRQNENAGYLTISLPFDNVDPLAVLEIYGKTGDFQYYWEHPNSGLSIAAGETLHICRHYGTDRFSKLNKETRKLDEKVISYSEIPHSLAGMNLFGGTSFFDKPLSGVWSSFGNGSFVLPGWTVIRDGKFSLLTLSLKIEEDDIADSLIDKAESKLSHFTDALSERLDQSVIFNGTAEAALSFTPENTSAFQNRWEENVSHAKDLIEQNVFEKIVMAREERLRTDRRANPTRLLHHLRTDYPECFSFLYQVNDQATFVGCTPEKLLSIESDRLYTDGLAGSISRGKTATQDEILSRKLLSSGKDLREHQFVVDSILEKLEDYSVEIDVPDQPGIRKYANVQHLHTPITASLNHATDVMALLEKMHPTPAVGGYPQDQALPYIQELEQIERGWYAGPIGWMNRNGRSEFAVAIRSGLIQPNKVRFYAGCGIVKGSDPEAEWRETELKLLPMLNALRHAAE